MKFNKLLIFGVVVTFLCGSGVAFFLFRSPPIDECNNFFTSGIYSIYREQLKNFVINHPFYNSVKEDAFTPFGEKVALFLETIETPLEHHDLRKAHESVIAELRRLLSLSSKEKEEDEKSRKLLDDIVQWIFLKADLRKEFQEFLFHHVPPPQQDLQPYLLTTQEALHRDSRFNGLTHRIWEDDGFFHGNLPTIYGTLLPPTSTKIIRMGKPVRLSKFPWVSPKVTPEFLKYIELRPGHFYVNLMRRTGGEGRSTRAIEALEHLSCPCYVITLDKDSSFYWQKDPNTPELVNSTFFKSEFLNKLLSQDGNFYWSASLLPEVWKGELEDLLNSIHTRYFDFQPSLNSEERKDFIELTYLAIIDTLIEKWRPPSMNITCNQGMDRAPSLLVLWLCHKNLLNFSEVTAFLLGPPLLVHNRSSYASRINRFVSAYSRITIPK